MIRNFVNLTNGIEAIPNLLPDWSAVRIQSTTIEKKNWPLLFSDLDHNFLFWLSQGVECHVWDFGCRREVSKVVGIGLPLINRMVNYVWNDVESTDPLFLEATWRILERSMTETSQQAKRKLRYYRQIKNCGMVQLFGHSQATDRDGDWEYYRKLLRGGLVELWTMDDGRG